MTKKLNPAVFERVHFLIMLSLLLYEVGYAIDGFYTSIKFMPIVEQYGHTLMLIAAYIFINTIRHYFLDYFQHQIFWWIKPNTGNFANWRQVHNDEDVIFTVNNTIKENGGRLYEKGNYSWLPSFDYIDYPGEKSLNANKD